MLIGLHGVAGSGKDTVFERAAVMAERIGVPAPKRLAFADPLKQSVAYLLGLTRQQIDELKMTGGEGALTVMGKPMSMRLFLQKYGTEAHRDVFGTNFWVDATLPKNFWHDGHLIFVTDVRFENEAKRIRQLGGKVIRVNGSSDLTAAAAGHASENPLEDSLVDDVIDNTIRDDGFDKLDYEVRRILAGFTPSLSETGDPSGVSIVD